MDAVIRRKRHDGQTEKCATLLRPFMSQSQGVRANRHHPNGSKWRLLWVLQVLLAVVVTLGPLSSNAGDVILRRYQLWPYFYSTEETGQYNSLTNFIRNSSDETVYFSGSPNCIANGYFRCAHYQIQYYDTSMDYTSFSQCGDHFILEMQGHPDIEWPARTLDVWIGDNPYEDPLIWGSVYAAECGFYDWGGEPSGSTESSAAWIIVIGPGSAITPELDHNDSGAPVSHTTEPINVIGGNALFNESDLVIPCPGMPLEFARYYNSLITNAGTLGQGWSHSYAWSLTIDEQSVRATTAGGRQYWFDGTTGTTFSAPFENNWRLAFTNNIYQVTLPGGVSYRFGTNGTLERIQDVWSNALFLAYTNTGSAEQLISVSSTNGIALSFTYTNERLSRIDTPSSNLWIEYQYDAYGKLTSSVRTAGAEISRTLYLYGANSLITQRVNAAGTCFAHSYSTNDNKAIGLKVDGTYYEHSVEYPSADTSTVTYARGAQNQVLTYAIDTNILRILSIAGPGSQMQDFSHDLSGNVTNYTVLDTNTGSHLTLVSDYDAQHNPISLQIGYSGQPTNEWLVSWDEQYNLPISVTDPEGHKLAADYVNASPTRIRLYSDSSNSWDTLFSYTTNGLLSAVTNANGNWARCEYDSLGRVNGIQPALGPAVTLSNNVLGFVEKITLPGDSGNRITTIGANELGWVTNVLYPDGLSERALMDAMGNVTNHVDTAGRTTRLTWLPTRKLSSVSRQLGTTNLTTSVAYDQQFNTLNITDEKGRAVESYQLDLEDRPISVTNLEGQTMSLSWAVGSFLNSVTRFDGTVVSNTFNSDGFLSSIAYPDATIQLSCLKNGLLKTAGNGLGVITNNWSFANRLTSQAQVVPSGTVSYTYWPAGHLSNVTSVAGSTTYTLDAADRFSSLSSSFAPSAPLVFNFSYGTNNGLVSSMTCTNTGIVASYGFDVMDQLTNLVWTGPTGNVLRSFAYAINNAGMITNVAHDDGSRTEYTLDDLDRLTGEKQINAVGITNLEQHFTYDEVGNRLTKVLDGATVSYAYSNGCNRLVGWTAASTNDFAASRRGDVAGFSSEAIGTNGNLGELYVSNAVGGVASLTVSGTNFTAADFEVGSGTQDIVVAIGDAAGNVAYATNTVVIQVVTNASYGFSAAGCVTSIQYQGSGVSETISLTWDSQYQLTEALTNGASAERYGYDALGRRAWIFDGVATNYLVYDQVVAEVSATGSLKRSYVWGPEIDNLLAMTVHTGATVRTYYALSDHLGSIHALVDETGQVVEQYRFDAWGRTTVHDANGVDLALSAVGNRYVWQGREISWKTGLYHFRARWYDPITGRWLSNDPIGISGGLNQYVFCGDNPVNARDAMGLQGGFGEALYDEVYGNSISSPESEALYGFCAGFFDWFDALPSLDDESSALAHRIGNVTSYVSGFLRMAYAGTARIISGQAIRRGVTVASVQTAIGNRNTLKRVFRGGLWWNRGITTFDQMMKKKGGDLLAILKSVGKTNKYWNLYGAGASFHALYDWFTGTDSTSDDNCK